jgi:oligo-1,6-glucosidase
MSVGEAIGVTPEQMPLFVDADRHELSMIFNFDVVHLTRQHWRKRDWTVPELKAALAKIDRAAGAKGWATSFLGNHDIPRPVSNFGDDRPAWREASAKALATVVLTQRATPFIYQGDELGMTNHPFASIDDYDDIEARGLWRTLVETGQVPAEEMLWHLAHTGRDHARTPMQWTAGEHGGFTTGRPWLAVNPNHREINAEAQAADPNSVFHHYRQLIALRKAHPTLIHGAFDDLDPSHHRVFAYTRTDDRARLVVVVNLSPELERYDLPTGLAVGDSLLTGGGPAPSPGASTLALAGWHSLVATLAS